MKILQKFLIALVAGFAASLAAMGCGVAETEPDPAYSVTSHFYPATNGIQYTYSRFNLSNRPDTATYQVLVGATSQTANRLVRVDRGNEVLYNFHLTRDREGNTIAYLGDSLNKFIALQGSLDVKSTWAADDNTTATVEAHYDEYLFPERQIAFSDVIVVKYERTTDAPGDYVVRYFARGYGLILERRIVRHSTTEIGTLQLVSLKSNTNDPIAKKQRFVEQRLQNPFLNPMLRMDTEFPDEK